MSLEETLSPRETYIFTLQELSSLDWRGAIDNPEKRKELIESYLQLTTTITEAICNIKTKKLSQFIADALPSLLRSLQLTSWSLLNLDSKDDSREQFEKIVDLLIDFVDSLSSRLPANASKLELCQTSSEEASRLRYLLAYILLEISANYIGPTSFCFALRYHVNNHPKYYAHNRPEVKVDEDSMLRLSRVLNTVHNIQLSFDSLLLHFDRVSDTGGGEYESGDDEQPLLFSKKGIAVLFASYFGLQKDPVAKATVTYPAIPSNLSLEQTYKHLIEYGALLMSSPEEKCHAIYDKGLMILFYLMEIVEPETISYGLLDTPFPIFGRTIMQVTQIIASFASLSPDARARFLAYRILSKHLMSMASDLRAVVLTELLTNCPFDTMKSAAINLLKESVERDFSSEKTRLFNSPVLFHQFLPVILSHEQEGTFTESLNHTIYGVNFYLYLLIRDQDNKTGVWDEENIRSVRSRYLELFSTEIGKLLTTNETSVDVPQNPREGANAEAQTILLHCFSIENALKRISEIIENRHLNRCTD